jgi:hypothetical protein
LRRDPEFLKKYLFLLKNLFFDEVFRNSENTKSNRKKEVTVTRISKKTWNLFIDSFCTFYPIANGN